MSGTVAHLLGEVHRAFFYAVHGTEPSAVTSLPAPNSPVEVKLFFFQQLGVYRAHSVSLSLPAVKSDVPSHTTYIESIPGLSGANILLTSLHYSNPSYIMISIFSFVKLPNYYLQLSCSSSSSSSKGPGPTYASNFSTF